MTDDRESVGRGRLDGLRILVVEDEFLVAMTIKAVLTEMGSDVIGPASRLPKAARLTREERFDGAVLDVNIDGQTIEPVARELRQRGVPIILLTGYGERAIAEDLRSAPRLGKPFDPERLQELAVTVFVGR